MNNLVKTLPIIIFSFASIAHSNEFSKPKLFGRVELNAPEQSHYEVLAKKFSEAGLAVKEEMEGTFLGRCFSKNDNTPQGMVNSTRKFVIETGRYDGPLFTPVTTEIWKNYLFLRLSSVNDLVVPAEENDNITSAEIDKAWENNADRINPLLESNGSIIGNDDNSLIETRKGTDGYFYTKFYSKTPDTETSYCYFYKKLF